MMYFAPSALIRQLKGKHKQIALQWIPGHCQITGNEQADLLAKITQTYIREPPYRSIKLQIKQVFRSAYRHELETRLSHKPVMGTLFKEGAKGKEKKNFRRANIIY